MGKPLAQAEPTVVTAPLSATGTGERPRPLALFAEGERIAGRYLVEGLLGVGGFGEVYRVRDERLDARRALKLQRLASSATRAFESLESEFELLASLVHPNLARVYDFGHLGPEIAFFTQDLVEGTPLIDTELKPDDPGAVPIWAQLCRALHYLHARGILHRDVKPSNVIVDLASGHVTLLDFGIAGAFGALDAEQLTGTLAYVAPEAIAGGPIDARSDLYSLGVTLYRQAVGQVPFRGSPSEVLSDHLLTDPEPLVPLGVREPVARVIERLLCKQPGARPASALEALRALAEANQVQIAEESDESLASYVLSARFVGHEPLLERLSELALSDAEDRQIGLVVGEAGSGKSRLLREVRQRVQLARRSWVLVGVKRSAAAKSVIQDIARAVLDEQLVASLDEDDRLELARALPELKKPRERIAIAFDPDRARRQRIAALARLIRRRFAGQPGVLAIEDLHWMSAEALAVLEQLIAAIRAEAAPCLLLLASRPGEVADRLEAATGALRLACDALSPEASARLVDSMFGSSDLLFGTELGQALAEGAHTAQFVQESLRLALEQAAIARVGDAWRVTGRVPALALLDVLAARFERLSAEDRRIALALAVLGGEASGPEVARVAGQPGARAAQALHDLVRSGLAEDTHDAFGRASYSMHDRYRDLVLERSPGAWTRAAHRRAARLLERSARGDWRELLGAADHFASARDLAAAVRVSAEGARVAERGGRPDQAALALETSIAWQRELGQVSTPTLLKHFDVALLAGMTDSVAATLRALEAEHEHATAGDRVEIALRRARLAARQGEAAAARETCEQALVHARELGEQRLEAELFLLLAQVDEDYGSIDRALDEFERAARIAEQCKARSVEAQAWLGASLAAVRLGTAGRAYGFAERALEAAHAARDPVLRAEALRHLGNSRRERGEATAALRLYRRAVRASREGGSVESEAKALNNLGTVCQWVGLVPEALSALERSLVLKGRLGLHASALLTKNNLGALHLAIGRHAEARAAFEEIVEHGGDATPVVVGLGYSNWADLCTLQQDFTRAVDLYRAAHAMNSERALAGQQSHALAGLMRVLVMRNQPGDVDEARELLSNLERHAEHGDLAETHRRFHTSCAMYYDAIGDPRRMLSHTRRVRTVREDPSAQFADVFGTLLESRWIEALALERLGRKTQARRAAERTLATLKRLARHVGDESGERAFLEASPLHRTICAQRLDTPRGWSWLPAQDEAKDPRARPDETSV